MEPALSVQQRLCEDKHNFCACIHPSISSPPDTDDRGTAAARQRQQRPPPSQPLNTITNNITRKKNRRCNAQKQQLTGQYLKHTHIPSCTTSSPPPRPCRSPSSSLKTPAYCCCCCRQWRWLSRPSTCRPGPSAKSAPKTGRYNKDECRTN